MYDTIWLECLCVKMFQSPLLWVLMYIRLLYRKHLRCFALEEKQQLRFITEESSPTFSSFIFHSSSFLMHVLIPFPSSLYPSFSFSLSLLQSPSLTFDLYSPSKWFRRFLLFLWSSKGLSLPRSPLMGLCMFCRLCICLRSLQYWCMANVSAGLKADTRALGCSEAAQPQGECLLLRALTRASLRIWRRILARVRLNPFSVARQ